MFIQVHQFADDHNYIWQSERLSLIRQPWLRDNIRHFLFLYFLLCWGSALSLFLGKYDLIRTIYRFESIRPFTSFSTGGTPR